MNEIKAIKSELADLRKIIKKTPYTYSNNNEGGAVNLPLMKNDES